MASTSTSSTVFPLSRLNFPLVSFKNITTTPSTSIHFHFHSKLTTLSLSRRRPDGFVVCSLSADHPQNSLSSDHTSQVQSSMWNWRGYSIRYQYSGSSGPALVLVHGFGANRSRLLTFRFSLADN